MKTTRKDQQKQSKKTETYKGVLELLLVIGIILLIPLFFAVRTSATSQPASPTQTITAPIMASASEESATVKVQRPPACTFPLAKISTEESQPEEYTFSEPKVVLTAPEGNIYTIAEWLPDNQQVLITEALRNNAKTDEINPETIKLFNPETGEIKVYATRPETQEAPLWQSELNAVVYPIKHFYFIDSENRIAKFTHQLWVSYGNPDTAQMLADNLPQLPFAIKPGGSEMLYLSDQQILKRNSSLKTIPSIAFDSTEWDYAKERRSDKSVSYNMAWQPGTSLIFLYSEGAMQGGGYTFILDANTGDVCELDLGGWAQVAHWSSDGRYLAIIRSTRYVFPTFSADLTVLDTVTGKLSTLSVVPQETDGLHFVNDFAWAPDNRHLLAIGDIYVSPDSQDKIGLYLVDLVSGQSVNVIPVYVSRVNSPQSMAWSPDGSKLIIRCPMTGVDRICFISVQRTGQ